MVQIINEIFLQYISAKYHEGTSNITMIKAYIVSVKIISVIDNQKLQRNGTIITAKNIIS